MANAKNAGLSDIAKELYPTAQELLIALLDMKDKPQTFREELEQLQEILKSTKPVLANLRLCGRKQAELKDFIKKLRDGKQDVKNCYGFQSWHSTALKNRYLSKVILLKNDIAEFAEHEQMKQDMANGITFRAAAEDLLLVLKMKIKADREDLELLQRTLESVVPEFEDFKIPDLVSNSGKMKELEILVGKLQKAKEIVDKGSEVPFRNTWQRNQIYSLQEAIRKFYEQEIGVSIGVEMLKDDATVLQLYAPAGRGRESLLATMLGDDIEIKGDLSITWAEEERYWKWDSLEETSIVRVDLAELIDVCWLEVRGKLDTSNLSPGIMYEVAFVMMLKSYSYGWETPVNFELTLPDGKKQEHEELLLSKPRNQWFEVPVGEFWTCQNMDGDMQFSLLETKGRHWKSGLVIKGAIIRPKSNCNTEKPGQNYFTVTSKDLSIIWGDDQRYWRWYCLNETRNTLMVAELLNVCWLEAKGKIDISKLSPGITYEVALVVMLKGHAYGWGVPITLQLVLPDGKVHERKECINHKPKGQWVKLKVGEFKKCAGKCGEIQFSLFEVEGQWKSGLVIKCVVIRPKN